jgi:hypothetical protein
MSSFDQSCTTPAPLAALDQSADAAYCQLLAKLYQASDDDDPIINAAVQEAINLCNKGNTAAGSRIEEGIPVVDRGFAGLLYAWLKRALGGELRHGGKLEEGWRDWIQNDEVRSVPRRGDVTIIPAIMRPSGVGGLVIELQKSA